MAKNWLGEVQYGVEFERWSRGCELGAERNIYKDVLHSHYTRHRYLIPFYNLYTRFTKLKSPSPTTMKLSATVLAAFLAVTTATPIAEAISKPSNPLEERAGPYCHSTRSGVHCYAGAGLAYTIKRDVKPADNAGGCCKAYGDLGNGHRYEDPQTISSGLSKTNGV